MSGNIIYSQHYNQTPEFLKANSIWQFGSYGAGIDFNSGTAVALPHDSFSSYITGSTNNFPGSGKSVLSDPHTGNLLFYTDGGTVWNSRHQPMPNGTGLLGNSYMNYYSTIQGTLIVPSVKDSNRYYLFSLAPAAIHFDTATGKSGSLFYSIVDMTLDNGNGDIDPNYKNIALDSFPFVGESLIAIPGCNDDIWVLTHADNYKAYHITESGLNPVPVVSSTNIGNLGQISFSLCVSPNRKKIVAASILTSAGIGALGNCLSELSDFDTETGKVVNPISLFADSAGGYISGAFSPDNSKLYLAQYRLDISLLPLPSGRLIQYDISVFDSLNIATSKQVISTAQALRAYGGLRLYNDTIYAADIYVPFFMGNSKVHRVSQPNNPGTACNFESDVVKPGFTNTQGSLGQDVVFAIPTDTFTTFMDTIMCPRWEDGVFLTVKDSSFSSYTWSTGASGLSAQINGHGTYWVSYAECNKRYIDSFVIKNSDLFTTITVDSFRLGTTGGSFTSYQWYFNGEPIPGADDSIYEVTANGDYTVKVTDEYGCSFLSSVYTVTNWITNINEYSKIVDRIHIYPNPSSNLVYINSHVGVNVRLMSLDGKIILNQNNAKRISVTHMAKGVYFLEIFDEERRRLKVEKVVINN